MPRARIELTPGQRFGRLEVLPGTPVLRQGHVLWPCICDCGTEKLIYGSHLASGRNVSCGCLRREKTIARSTKHGMATRRGRTPTYSTWRRMIRYTTDPDHPRYPDWGGRGIKVCERWMDYPAFLADMGEKPPGMSIDRIDNDGDYEPSNCRWATPVQQARNQRRFKLTPQAVLEIQRLYAEGLPIGGIAEITGVGRHTVGTVCTVLDALT